MFENLTHHAYLVIGPLTSTLTLLRERFAAQEPIERVRTQWVIGDSRELREFQARRVGEGERRIFLLGLESITIEAQHALLKTLEEPAAGNLFFLVAPAQQIFLPTVLSRVQILRTDQAAGLDWELKNWATQFLAAGPEARLAQVAELLASAEGVSAGERNRAGEAVRALIDQILVKPFGPERERSLAFLAQALDYLNDRAAVTRLLLEYLALVL